MFLCVVFCAGGLLLKVLGGCLEVCFLGDFQGFLVLYLVFSVS